jgi:hypothetical protein
MSSNQHMRRALWHAKACVRCLRKSLTLAGQDPDAPIDDEPPSQEGNYGDDPDPLLPRPRGRYLRLMD